MKERLWAYREKMVEVPRAHHCDNVQQMSKPETTARVHGMLTGSSRSRSILLDGTAQALILGELGELFKRLPFWR
jgi:hypothetical protein